MKTQEELMNRRDFIKVNMKSSFRFLAEFVNSAYEEDATIIRPPGADNEWSFLSACTRCGKCQDVCPQSIIKLFNERGGTAYAFTPYIDLTVNPCTMCNKCTEVCPTDALTGENGQELAKVQFHSHHCLTYEGVLCDSCIRKCPEKALSLDKTGRLELNQELCNGCAVCHHACIQAVSPFSFHPVK